MKSPSALRPSFRRPLVQCADVASRTDTAVEFSIGPQKVRLVVIIAGIRTEDEKGGKEHVVGLLRSMVMCAIRNRKLPVSVIDVGAVAVSIYDNVMKPG